MANTPEQIASQLRATAARMRTVDLTVVPDLELAAETIEALSGSLEVERALRHHPYQAPGRRITERDEAFALRAGAVVVNDHGRAFQIRPRPGALDGFIDHSIAAWLLPLRVVHEGN